MLAVSPNSLGAIKMDKSWTAFAPNGVASRMIIIVIRLRSIERQMAVVAMQSEA